MTKQPTYTELYITVQELLKRVNGLEGLVKQNQKLTRENALLKERLKKIITKLLGSPTQRK